MGRYNKWNYLCGALYSLPAVKCSFGHLRDHHSFFRNGRFLRSRAGLPNFAHSNFSRRILYELQNALIKALCLRGNVGSH